MHASTSLRALSSLSVSSLSVSSLARLGLPLALASLAAAGCAGGDPLTGTWEGDTTTPLPEGVGGGDLAVHTLLTFDGAASPGTFDLHLDLSFEALSDTVDAHGTYVEDGSTLTLTLTGFTIDEASGNAAFVADDGSQCLTLQGFGGAPVCFPVPQANAYSIEEATLSATIDQSIAGAPVTQTQLTLEERP